MCLRHLDTHIKSSQHDGLYSGKTKTPGKKKKKKKKNWKVWCVSRHLETALEVASTPEGAEEKGIDPVELFALAWSNKLFDAVANRMFMLVTSPWQITLHQCSYRSTVNHFNHSFHAYIHITNSVYLSPVLSHAVQTGACCLLATTYLHSCPWSLGQKTNTWRYATIRSKSRSICLSTIKII